MTGSDSQKPTYVDDTPQYVQVVAIALSAGTHKLTPHLHAEAH